MALRSRRSDNRIISLRVSGNTGTRRHKEYRMKTIATILILTLLAFTASAQSYDRATVTITSTTNAATVTNELVPNPRGELFSIGFTFTPATLVTNNITVVRKAGFAGPAVTILPATGYTSATMNPIYPVHLVSTNGTNVAAWFAPYVFLGDSALQIITTNTCVSNTTIRVDAVYKRN